MLGTLASFAAGLATGYTAARTVARQQLDPREKDQLDDLSDHVLVPRGLAWQQVPDTIWQTNINGCVPLRLCVRHGNNIGVRPATYAKADPYHWDIRQSLGHWRLAEAKTFDAGIPEELWPYFPWKAYCDPGEHNNKWGPYAGICHRFQGSAENRKMRVHSLPASLFGLCGPWPPAVLLSDVHLDAWIAAHQAWWRVHPARICWIPMLIINFRTSAILDLQKALDVQFEKPYAYRQKGLGVETEVKIPEPTKTGLLFCYLLSCSWAASVGLLSRPPVLRPVEDLGVDPPLAGYSSSAKTVGLQKEAIEILEPIAAGMSIGGPTGAGIGIGVSLGKRAIKLLTGGYEVSGATELIMPDWQPIAVPRALFELRDGS